MGLWSSILDIIYDGLQAFYGVVGDYGVAIILLTAAIRVVLMPLTIKQTKSMYEMQRVQPKIKELQKKYKDDQQKLQEEMMKFYQENKVNPFGGCLPTLLQMPVFIALFQVLRERVPAGADFWIILPDLTASPQSLWGDVSLFSMVPYVALVVMFGLSVWLPMQLMPGEQQQKRIGMYMAIMMLYFGWISPAGVLLYWVTSSVWQIVQQQITLRVYSTAQGA